MKILNIGVLAHVDAGKTTLTEQLLYRAGIIEQPGSVDHGNTTTDSLEIERKRGITVKSAAVSFSLDDLKVNLIDTPGHADFISEVEHSLTVLDGVILVISAVEGVQSQTKVLMQTLKEQRIPTILFMNKMDRMGANYQKTRDMIQNNLVEEICELNEVMYEGTSTVKIKRKDPKKAGWIETLALNNETLLYEFANDLSIPDEQLFNGLHEQVKNGVVYPLFAGSAAKGVGIDHLLSSLSDFFPVCYSSQKNERPLAGIVFKIIKHPNGTREAFVRLFEGQLRIRDEVQVITQNGQYSQLKIKQLQCLKNGKQIQTAAIEAGDIGVLTGSELKVGDVIGTNSDQVNIFTFHRPPIQVQINTAKAEDSIILHQALTDLTTEDPFLQYVYHRETKENMIHVFGKVQQEILTEMIQQQYGIDVIFSAPKVICIEKPLSTGNAAEYKVKDGNPFWATVGFRVEPGEEGSGLQYRLEVELGSLPLSFQKAIKETVEEVLKEGLYGWNVTDIIVTLTHSGYESACSTAKDFRSLVPLVLMNALHKAGTNVYEPVNSIQLTLPESSLSKVLSRLSVLKGTYQDPQFQKEIVYINGTIPVRHSDLLELDFHSLTSGEGTISIKPGGYKKVDQTIPKNKRSQPNPLNRGEYFLHLNKIV
ncbi:tetracycline resistance protein [Bacillus sp. SA1-12]|uniref:elongation factor G n=1 Tax=Bacillus sp. SA1-12 TaxID=1455638 RepID=UPI0006270689|nr:TetM/TetW/TetO/TetS family tetracycline resistance ribosomal protection protein [Bacillus sp. SA1-12]KKI90008.1 tetracycline resistance protein [Bacillus sp. SA1-12]